MKNKIYLHIGFGKTGSTSLQSFLFCNPVLQTSVHQETILYCCLYQHGILSFAKGVAGLSECSFATNVGSELVLNNKNDYSKIKNDLDKIFSAGYTPLFSQEAWGYLSSEFTDSNIFSELGCSAHVIAYVRPQVEWLNSAWWQWGAWKREFSTPYNAIRAKGYNTMLWAEHIEKWRSVPGVERVSVRLQPKDIVADFMSLLGIQNNHGIIYPKRNNVSLSPILIKLLLRYSAFRGAHNPEIDSILQKYFNFEGKSPWVIEKELVDNIIQATHADNLMLLGMLDEPSRKVMENDPRWWNPDFYASRPLFSTADHELDKQELLAIVKRVVPALRSFQPLNQRWWNPGYYASRPHFSKTESELDKEELLAIVDHAIPDLIRLELNEGNERDERNDGTVLDRSHIQDSTGWRNTRYARIIHRILVNKPYHLMRRIVRIIWLKMPFSTPNKLLLKHKLFSNLPYLFRWSPAYRRWHAINTPSDIKHELTTEQDARHVASQSAKND